MANASDFLEPVLAIWREVLARGARELSADSNFFLSGGDSLDLSRVLVRVRERLGAELDTRDVRRFTTPRAMARCCALAASTQTRAIPADIRPAPAMDLASYPCSIGQRALWLAEQASGAAGLYNTAVALRFTGRLRIDLLARALGAVLTRHEVLRSCLRADAHTAQLIGVIMPPQDVVLDTVLSTRSTLYGHLEQAAAEPFDLEHGPLWRVRLFRHGPQQWTLLLCVHHAVTDGWSGAVLLGSLAEAYEALACDSSWHPEKIEREFPRWCMRGDAIPAQDTWWWRDYLAGAAQLNSWPLTGSRRWPFVVAREDVIFEQGLAERIEEAARDAQVRKSALFLTAFRLALQAISGFSEICIATPVNLRNSEAQEASVGYFVNLVVTRTSIAGNSRSRTLLARVQSDLDDALRRRAVPYAELVEQLKPPLLPSGNAWCDVLFAFQNLPERPVAFPDLQVDVEALTSPLAQFPLKLEVLCRGNSYECQLTYARDCITDSAADWLLFVLEDQLEELIEGLGPSI